MLYKLNDEKKKIIYRVNRFIIETEENKTKHLATLKLNKCRSFQHFSTDFAAKLQKLC